MAATQQQRAKLYTTLAETMDEEAADTLLSELPPGGWEQMATKEDLAGVEARLTAAITAGLAELSVKMTDGLAQAAKERTEGFAHAAKERAEGFAHAAKERADIHTQLSAGLTQAAKERAEINTRLSEGLAQAAHERAEIYAQLAPEIGKATTDRAEIRGDFSKLRESQARHLLVIVSTICLATISIWITLFVTLGNVG